MSSDGLPVDAVCTGCKETAVMRIADTAPDPELDADELTSFRHFCRRCGVVQWWNPVAVLSGMIESEHDPEG